MPINEDRTLSDRHKINTAIDHIDFSGVDFLDAVKKMGIEGGHKQRHVATEMRETAIKLISAGNVANLRDTLQRRFKLNEEQLAIAADTITSALTNGRHPIPGSGGMAPGR